ncbi:hypothetical protein M3Y96_00468900 [Aphelenchoides besseyi]|nr:hypothetical protein M3Y96_00468900 [Aphelenchoides besseyi]
MLSLSNMSINRLLTFRWNIVCLVFLFCLLAAQAQDQEIEFETLDEYKVTTTTAKPKCTISSNPALLEIMDKVCELCHDMYSHQNPNMMSHCTSGCYRSMQFKKCLHLFSPTRTLRHVLRRH